MKRKKGSKAMIDDCTLCKDYKELLEAMDAAWKLSTERAEAAEAKVWELGADCTMTQSKFDDLRMDHFEVVGKLEARVRELEIVEGAYDLAQQSVHNTNMLNQELKSKLSRYEQGVKVEDVNVTKVIDVLKEGFTGYITVKVGAEYLGQRVTVIVLKEDV